MRFNIVTDYLVLMIAVRTQTKVKERTELCRVFWAPVIKQFESAVTGRACKTNMTLWLGAKAAVPVLANSLNINSHPAIKHLAVHACTSQGLY